MEEASKRDFHIREIKRLNNEFQSECVFNKLSQFELDEYIKLLDDNFSVVRTENIELICGQKANETQSNQINAEYAEIEKVYISLKAKLRSRSENLLSKAVMPLSENKNHSKVEKTWNNFSGEQIEWMSFYVNFDKAVKNNAKISEAKKLEMLVDSTGGEAQALVNRFETFDDAWQKLKITYGNAFHQAHAALKAMMNIKTIEKRSIEAITSLINQTDRHVDVLNITLEIQDFKSLIPLIIVDKLDNATKKAWYKHYVSLAESWAKSSEVVATNANKAIKFIPVWMNMRDFLASEVGNLKRATNMRTESSSHTLEVNKVAQIKRKEFCTSCKAFHRLYKCEKFKSMCLKQRLQHVADHNLCERCLHPPHSGPCRDPKNNEPCEVCKPSEKFHNSTICPTLQKSTKLRSKR